MQVLYLKFGNYCFNVYSQEFFNVSAFMMYILK
jgi:hypothetical protein